MLGLDKIFQMDRGKSPLSGKGEEVQEVSIVPAVFIDPDIFEEKRRPLETLRDFETLVTDGFIVTDILRPDPRGFQQLHRIGQLSVEAKVSRILKITVLLFLSLSGGMAIVVDVLEVVGTLPEADIIDDQFQMTLHRFPDRFEGFELPVDVFVNDDFFYPHVLVLEGLPYRVDSRDRGDLYFEAGKTFSHKVDQIGNPHGHSIGPGSVNPFKKLDQLSIAFLRILEVSETGGIEEIAELQPSIVAGLDVGFHILSFDLRKNKTGSRPADNIKREFAEKSIYRCPFHSIQEGNIPVGTHPQFHHS